jgi:hypothetical protein
MRHYSIVGWLVAAAIMLLTSGLALPAAAQTATPTPVGPPPIAIFIEEAGVFHPIVPVTIVNGAMESPPTSVVVGWYAELGRPGDPDNTVLAGYTGSTGDRPGVFGRLSELEPGDIVEVLDADGGYAVYSVLWVRTYPTTEDVPIPDVVGQTPGDHLTLYTGGPGAESADPVIVVRAARVPAADKSTDATPPSD